METYKLPKSVDLAVMVTIGLMLFCFMFTQIFVASEGQVFLLLLLFVGVLGVPHGAFDYDVAKKSGLIISRWSAVCFFSCYLLMAFLAFSFWLYWPAAGLMLFLLVSLWHFSHDWSKRGVVFQSAMALLVITGPFVFWPQDVMRYFNMLLFGNTLDLSSHAVHQISHLLIIAIVCVIMAKCLQRQWADFMEGAILLIGVAVFSPLFFFIIYFCGLHSMRSLVHLRYELGGSTRRFVLRGLIPTLLTYGLGFAVYALVPQMKGSSGLLNIVFIGLFSLTIPHIFLDLVMMMPFGGREKKLSGDTAVDFGL